MVLYEAPHRVPPRSRTCSPRAGRYREVAVARELTKLHEEVWRGPLAAAVGHVERDRTAAST